MQWIMMFTTEISRESCLNGCTISYGHLSGESCQDNRAFIDEIMRKSLLGSA